MDWRDGCSMNGSVEEDGVVETVVGEVDGVVGERIVW